MEKVAVAKTGPSLNEDVVIIILSKLPVKSLIRFKCVCKSWYSLIQSPFFITTHLNSNKVHHRDYLGLLMNDGVITSRQYLISFFSYNPIKFDMMKFSSKLILPFKCPRIIGSCNGLLCMVTETFEYYVLNPATREFKTLEQHEHWENLCYGFGFDPKANDYKLVRFTVGKTEVLTLKSNSWRPIIVMSDEDHSTSVMKGVRLVEYWSKAVLNNALHWVGESSVRKRKY
ncbi:F-box domain containing protein [Parasponia andersonii]|uniref:F-box domain containing protein n=1 Tax=Parasponia andersonii TaxID=3476 RepID=A0A2P5C0P6_PARAD|nr:F-box domain containing protein [Parasponia andersonii]